MIVYTVHEPPIPAKTHGERADEVVFVKEGFTRWGFLFPPFWLMFNALWLELAGAVLVAAAAAWVLTELGLKDQVWAIAYVLLMPVVGFEGNGLRRGCLERKGYIYLASVAGHSLDECERRFFDAWLPGIAGPGAAKREPGKASTGSSGSSGSGWRGPGVVGIFPGEAL
jgi:Protein of unknown function (DUF2628)